MPVIKGLMRVMCCAIHHQCACASFTENTGTLLYRRLLLLMHTQYPDSLYPCLVRCIMLTKTAEDL